MTLTDTQPAFVKVEDGIRKDSVNDANSRASPSTWKLMIEAARTVLCRCEEVAWMGAGGT